MSKPDSQIMYAIFESLLHFAKEHKHPEATGFSDIAWILALIRSGAIRREDGTAFSPDISFDEFTAEVLKEPKKNVRLQYENGENFEPLSIALVGHEGQLLGASAYLESEGCEETFPLPGSKTASFRSAPQNVDTAGQNSRVYEDVLTAVRDLYQDLKATDSVFSSDSTAYEDLKGSLKTLTEKLTNRTADFTKEKSLDDLNNMFRNVLANASTYVSSKTEQTDLSSRQLDRLGVCMQLRDLGKLVSAAAKSENDLDELKRFNRPEEDQKDAERKLTEARKALRTRELLENKVAGKLFFAGLKEQGPDAALRVLKNQHGIDVLGRKEEKDKGLYDTFVSKLKASEEFKENLVGKDRLYYGQKLGELYELSQKSPSSLLKKYKALQTRSAERSAARGKQSRWKSTEAEKLQQKEILARINKLNNPDLAAICEYTLKMTDQMTAELDRAESHSHSASYQKFRGELEAAHKRIIDALGETAELMVPKEDKLQTITKDSENAREKVSRAVYDKLADVFRDVSAAAADYQQKHIGASYGSSGNNVIRRLEVATGVRVINDFLTDPKNASDIVNAAEGTMNRLVNDVCVYRVKCRIVNDALGSMKLATESVDELLFDKKSPSVRVANREIAMLADYDSPAGFKAETDDYKLLPKVRDLILEKDPWGKLSGVKSERQLAAQAASKKVGEQKLDGKKVEGPQLGGAQPGGNH